MTGWTNRHEHFTPAGVAHRIVVQKESLHHQADGSQYAGNRAGRVCTILAGLLWCGLFAFGCAQQKPPSRFTQYRFEVQGESYRLRSLHLEDHSASYNELVGADVVAVDFDQDRVIDRIMLGEMSLSRAQEIYTYGLDLLARKNRLAVRTPNLQRYLHESNGHHIEIRSFRPANVPPFNEFIIANNRPLVCPELIILMDQNADGTLEEVLQGEISLAEAQARYTAALRAGLQKGQLIEANGTILVKEK